MFKCFAQASETKDERERRSLEYTQQGNVGDVGDASWEAKTTAMRIPTIRSPTTRKLSKKNHGSDGEECALAATIMMQY